ARRPPAPPSAATTSAAGHTAGRSRRATPATPGTQPPGRRTHRPLLSPLARSSRAISLSAADRSASSLAVVVHVRGARVGAVAGSVVMGTDGEHRDGECEGTEDGE